ncbi:MAG: hypothetical protein AVDCRST_MAG37-3601 [uncultured Rubrobacteraceae bacterium]|uniref:Uncharacterized protein n=1 Tax=uncultured Rubrobacteraceae bacterium TaxID=349277 RepID=A0A6J4QZJ1_9ACTN|nr:MAG: hypothetical protein AVDCRST_MAG37-3601 [uncultured Rubrobacteraceae bacterium]
MRKYEGRANRARLLVALATSAFGMLLALAAAALAYTQQVSVFGVTSIAFGGILLGIIGYFLDARRLGITASVLSVVGLIFGLAVI